MNWPNTVLSASSLISPRLSFPKAPQSLPFVNIFEQQQLKAEFLRGWASSEVPGPILIVEFHFSPLEGLMVEAETPVLWPPHAKSWLIWEDPDAGKDWGQEKGTTEDEMVGWHHRLNGHGFGWTLAVGDGQGGLACCSSWGGRVRHDWETELSGIDKHKWRTCYVSNKRILSEYVFYSLNMCTK